jgi:hypothetical protein
MTPPHPATPPPLFARALEKLWWTWLRLISKKGRFETLLRKIFAYSNELVGQRNPSRSWLRSDW